MKVSITSISVVLLGFVAVAFAQRIPLPEPGPVSGPWVEKIFLTDSDATPEEAVRFCIVDDPKVGRTLTIGPWLAGSWSARVAYATDFPPHAVNLVGRYRTIDLPHTTPVVRCESYDDHGKRLNDVSYHLPLSPQWNFQ